MQGGLGLVGVGGGGGGGKGGGSANESTVSKVEKDYDHHPAESDELELGLGLSLGGGKSKGSAWGECGRILTAKDFPSAVSGTKRAADSVSHEGGSPPSISQVVGWPPIRAYRMNSLVNQAKAPRSEEEKVGSEKEKSKDNLKKKICNGNKTNNMFNEKGHLGFVKVNIDGLPIGRKVDLNAHACYETLAQTLEEMFFSSTPTINSIGSGAEKKDSAAKTSKLLDGSSEFVLTYEDKEGDWMLVGDVPWGMFLCSVKRLRIMRTSEANGLGPIFQERNEKQKAKKRQRRGGQKRQRRKGKKRRGGGKRRRRKERKRSEKREKKSKKREGEERKDGEKKKKEKGEMKKKIRERREK